MANCDRAEINVGISAESTKSRIILAV